MSSLGLLSINILMGLSNNGVNEAGYEVYIWHLLCFPAQIIPLKNLT